MVFVTAFLWGTALSLGLCVGLAAWAFIRPRITGENNGLMTVHEVNRLSVEALHERNQLTVSLVEQVERIADGLEGGPRLQAIVDRLPKTGDDVPIAVNNHLWSTEGPVIRHGIVKSMEAPVLPRSRGDEYVIILSFGGGTWKVSNRNCYSTYPAASAAKAASVKDGDD